MRIFLLPISTRRTLLYCEKLAPSLSQAPSSSPARRPAPASSSSPSTAARDRTQRNAASAIAKPEAPALFSGPVSELPDRIVHRANSTWADWERSDTGWKRFLTRHGNNAFRRIPFEEWGLKSLPALSESSRASLLGTSASTESGAGAGAGAATGQVSAAQAGGAKSAPKSVTVLFPPSFIAEEKVLPTLRRLATERLGLHKNRLYWSVVGLPVALPFGLVPILPNVPFFYLAFRAWSHYKALYGSRYLGLVLDEKLAKPRAEGVLDSIYSASLLERRRVDGGAQAVEAGGEREKGAKDWAAEVEGSAGKEEVMLLHGKSGQLLADEFDLPELEIEVERAVEQVEAAIAKAKQNGPAKGKAD